MQIWVADGERGLMRKEGDAWARVGPPGDALCAGAAGVYFSGQGQLYFYPHGKNAPGFHVSAPPGVCALAMIGNRVAALSNEADSVTAFSAATGEALFAAPAGVYPRDLSADAQGKYLAVAGGASGEALILDAGLRLVKAYRLPGTVCGVCFAGKGIAALCAVEEGERVTSRLMAVSPWGAVEEAAAHPLTPACLCGLAGGVRLMGCYGQVVALKANKKAALRQPFPCPVRIRPCPGGALICDACLGTVAPLAGKAVYTGASPQDALCVPGVPQYSLGVR